MDRQPLQNVDFLSFEWQVEDIFATEKYIRQHKLEIEGYDRLRYALWRNWAKQRNNQLSCPPSIILWSVTCPSLFIGIVLEIDRSRDKDADTTWLYGPLKRFHSPQYRSAYPALVSPNSGPLTSSHDIFFTKTRKENDLLAFSRKTCLTNKTQYSYFTPRRVKFSSEVRQAVYLPSDPHWYWYWWRQIRNQESGISQERLRFLGYIFRVYRSGRTILNVPSSTLKSSCTPCPCTLSGEDCRSLISGGPEYVLL